MEVIVELMADGLVLAVPPRLMQSGNPGLRPATKSQALPRRNLMEMRGSTVGEFGTFLCGGEIGHGGTPVCHSVTF